MPWPMVHFAVSQRLYADQPTPSLLIGSIAPDSIHVRGQISREEKGFTHLVHNGRFAPVELIMEKIKEYMPMHSQREWQDFVVGYFTHIYTDLRWVHTIYADFEAAYTGEHIRSVYNEEVSQAEFELKRSMANYEDLILLLSAAEGYTIDPFLTQSEVNTYRDLKVEWLQDSRNEPNIKPVYFESAKIHRFIEETTNEIKTLFNEYNIKSLQEIRNASSTAVVEGS